MKTYLVTVERLTIDNRVYHTHKYTIVAHCEEEASSIVSNFLELHFEPNFRVSEVTPCD